MGLEQVAEAIAAMHGRVAEVERRVANIMRPGKVMEVDHAKGLVRVKVGDLESAMVPWMERAGAIKTWSPPAVGEQVTLFSPSGEPGQGWVMTGGYSDANPQPHDQGGEQKLVAAKILLVGDVTITGEFKANGSAFQHNGRNVGDTHTHKGVTPGPATTQDPS